jgi:hypothetical protein
MLAVRLDRPFLRADRLSKIGPLSLDERPGIGRLPLNGNSHRHCTGIEDDLRAEGAPDDGTGQ